MGTEDATTNNAAKSALGIRTLADNRGSAIALGLYLFFCSFAVSPPQHFAGRKNHTYYSLIVCARNLREVSAHFASPFSPTGTHSAAKTNPRT